ncbi:uncharacterized protein BDR25DRAFT_299783 [Lindgomyces ingoldianus]|uniref:Uncharacterized protein n=1 Tax=Lindgomyces ingoldianus TaxID=673940 RepID=A0ACB6RFT4_9PLEO|nr:uncharacterized protein BDR25DRAFT_299783 [Lindgomyces ingoldianus]KAF2478066.1 hypothetical protein BDR25DRAFT_299783 [Lindgomyces ingoldianus]
MSTSNPPPPDAADAPPSYESAIGSSTPTARISTDSLAARTARNGIPPERRRSMEDENRPLPPGWIRQFDATEQHQFFVDTKASPPRSIWVHPYDDDEYLSTLSPEERKEHGRMRRTMTMDDLAAESSDDEGHGHHHSAGAQLPPRGGGEGKPKGIHKFGRKMKDKLTATTHEQREAQRREREEQERRAYMAHMQARQAMVRALETGQPQFLCKDAQGRDVYIEPPNGPAVPRGAYGYNPYAEGPYTDPNARFVRPAGPYGRPYGRGYGGGLGAPVAAGFLGGALFGGLLF